MPAASSARSERPGCRLSARSRPIFPISGRDFGNLAEYDAHVAGPAILALYVETEPTKDAGRRAAVAARALEVAKSLNQRYADTLRGRWEPIGDAALRAIVEAPAGASSAHESRARAGRATEMAFELVLRMQPIRLRLGLGCAPGKEPTALARAREAVTAAARARLFAQARGFETLGAPRGSDAAVGGAWAITGALTRSWTDRQAQFVRWVLRDGVLDWRREPPRFVKERRRKEVAAGLGVSPSVVTESLQAADVASFRHAIWSAAWSLAQTWSAAEEDYSSSAASASSVSMTRS